MPTALAKLLRQHIQTHGSLTVEKFMQQCLYHPQHGYYTRGLNFTAPLPTPPQDFTTAPELTPLFGQTLAEWLVQITSSPAFPSSPFTLLEAGPGRGLLMLHMLHYLQQTHPSTYQRITPVLVETSPILTQIQQQTLKNFPQCQWVQQLTASNQPTICMANELLDAFPSQQFCGEEERTITLNKAGEFTFSHPDNAVTHESSPSQTAWLQSLKAFPNLHTALLIDYGYTQSSSLGKDTLQALHRHHKVSPFHLPGESDLTTHVNFTHVAEVLGKEHSHIQDLSPFLLQHGLLTVANTPHSMEDSALPRLLHPAHMGTLFKVLCYMPNTP